jgi:glycosyltransferase involved in cell wall biosynthesis
MSEIRVLQFITPSGFYGAERWVLALANNLNNTSLTCDLAASEEGGAQDLSILDYYPSGAGLTHRIKMSSRFDWRAIKRLCQVIQERKIDIIHTHGYKSDILGLWAAKLTGIHCLSTPHGFSGNVDFKLRTFIRLGIFIWRYFDAVSPLSDELMEDMKRLKVPPQKTRLILNGVDLKEIDGLMANLGKKPVSSSSEKVIGFVGQMIPRKGIPELIEVFDRLYTQDANLKLMLVGDGPQRPELEASAARLPSAGAIEFTGFRNDRLALLKSFDLFVMTSSLEGIPRCMMEAMAVGTPVAAYDIPGVNDLIEDGVTGLSATYGDRDGLTDVCRKALYDLEGSRKRALKARQMIDQNYSAARMAEEYESLYRELLEHGQLVSHQSAKGTV